VLKKALSGETASVIEEKYVRVDGKVINVEVSSHPVTYEGEPAVQVIVKDITDRKVAEVTIRKAENSFSQLFQNSPLAIVMLNDRGSVVGSTGDSRKCLAIPAMNFWARN